MKIQANNSSARVSHKGGLRTLNKINPISLYGDRYFNRMARSSADRIEPISPALVGNVKNVFIKNISAWDINPSNSDEYVLFLHGMSQNVTNYQHLYENIITKNKGVFAVEYRGYGQNKAGNVSEDRLRKDVVNAYNYLTKEKGIKPQNIVVAGHSMGGALSVDFASKHQDIKSLVLICPITNMANLGNRFLGHKTLGLGVPDSIRKLTFAVRPLYWLSELRFNSMGKIGKVKSPTYIVQSQNDSVTPVEFAGVFAEKARKNGILKQFITLPSGGHKVDHAKLDVLSGIFDNIFGK